MKRQHDVGVGDTRLQQFRGEAVFRAIPFDPDFFVVQPNVKHSIVDAALVLPANPQEQILAALIIENADGFDIRAAASVGKVAPFCEASLNQISVTGHSIHCDTSSFSRLTINNLSFASAINSITASVWKKSA
jgi:hypothetical protein